MIPAPKKSVWVLEDEKELQEIYRDFLSDSYQVRSFLTIADTMQEVKACVSHRHALPDVMLCDLRLPDGNFLEATHDNKEWREFADSTRIVMITANDDVSTVKRCLAEGALDCMSKPFRRNELRAKLEHFISQPVRRELKKQHGDIKIDLHDLRVYRGERQSEPFTNKELQIMSIMLDSPGFSAKRSKVVEDVWKTTKVTAKTLDVHLFNLRRKLAKLGVSIKFIEPSSYVLVLEDVPKL